MDNLSSDIPFGYDASSQSIEVNQITTSKIILKSPVISDELGNKITKYTVMISKYPLSQILDDVDLLDESQEKTFEFSSVGSTITMELSTTIDGISASQVYYVSVIPKDDNGILGEISNELWFKLATQTYGDDTSDTSNVHGAAGANMTLANVRHTITNNKATLRWTAVDGSDTVDIFLWNPTSEVFERLSSVKMSDESYTFTLTRNGEYIVNFMPNNDGTEYRYTFVVSGLKATTTPSTSTTTKPTIGKIPATGPKENVLLALAISVVLYMVYRKITAKRS